MHLGDALYMLQPARLFIIPQKLLNFDYTYIKLLQSVDLFILLKYLLPSIPGIHPFGKLKKQKTLLSIIYKRVIVKKSRQLPILPEACAPSTVGHGGLNFRVRDGNGCIPSGIVTGNPFVWVPNIENCIKFNKVFL